jgi:hypothetical protein
VNGYAAWENEVEAYLDTLDDKSFLAQFQSARGNGQMLIGRSIEGGGWYALLQGKLGSLNGFVGELRR